MRFKRNILEDRLGRSRIRKRHTLSLKDQTVRGAMDVRMLWKHLFIPVDMHAAAIMIVWLVAAFVPMEMIVHGAVCMLMQMRVQYFAFPVLRTHRLYPLYNRNRNSGAPRNDVMAPIGNMTGEMTIRATKSDASMIVAPKARDAGRRKR